MHHCTTRYSLLVANEGGTPEYIWDSPVIIANLFLRAHIATHFAKTSTQKGAAGAAIAEKVSTPSMLKNRPRLSLQVYRKRNLDPLGLLGSSDTEFNDPSRKR